MSTSRGGDEPTFLATEPPPWAVRGLSALLLALFVVVAVAAVTVKVPETVRGSFTLVPKNGTDPLRSSREGTIGEVHVVDGEMVTKGTVLFVIRSAPVRDREAELGSINAQLGASQGTLVNARQQLASTRASDEAEQARLQTHLTFLAKLVPIKRRYATLAEQEAARRREGFAKQVVSATDVNAAEQEAQRLAGEAATTESEEAETRANLAKLLADMRSRALQGEQTLRQLSMASDQGRIRGAALAADSTDWSHGMLAVHAPCTGTMLRVKVTTPGAVVQAGESLAEIACTDAPLQAEVRLPEDGLALLRPGQGVKLLYDAFPYQRFGVRHGVVRWVGAAGLQRDSTTLPFRSLVDVDSTVISVSGERRTLVAGMGGQALIVVGRRPLMSYLFEPIRQLKESMSDAPAAKP